MKYKIGSLLLFFSLGLYSQTTPGITWMRWEEAVEAHAESPRMWFIDTYTDWCPPCKLMDETTFKDTAFIRQLQAHYYPVKLNAEERQTLYFQEQEFKFVPSRRNGFNELAFHLLDGKLAYPSFVLLNDKGERIGFISGYRDAPQMLRLLEYGLIQPLPKFSLAVWMGGN